MANLEGVKAGDEVVVTSVHRSSGDGRTVKVHKVGRTLVHVLKYEEHPEYGTDTYRIETGRSNDAYGHTRLWKPEDWEAEKKRDGLEEALKLHGIEVWRKKQPIAVLEALFDVMERAERGEIK